MERGLLSYDFFLLFNDLRKFLNKTDKKNRTLPLFFFAAEFSAYESSIYLRRNVLQGALASFESRL